MICNVNGDSLDDMIVTFNTTESGIACFNTFVEITGETNAGDAFIAQDSITTENCENSCHP